jgi:sugar phosphate isomerase/epimerase
MKLYANTWCYRDFDRETAFREIARLGYQGVEIIAHGPCWHADPLDTADDLMAALDLLSELNLDVIAISPATEYLLFDTDQRRQMVEHTMAMTDITLLYGAEIVRIFAGGTVPEGRTQEECIDAVVEALRPCVDYAEKRGARLAVESHGQFGTDLDVLVSILDHIQSPALGITLDTSNFAVNGVDPLDAIDAFGSRIFHTHMKDSSLGSDGYGTAVGEGSLNFDAILRKLKAAGYHGAYCVEYEGEEAPNIGLEKSRKFLTELFEKLNL